MFHFISLDAVQPSVTNIFLYVFEPSGLRTSPEHPVSMDINKKLFSLQFIFFVYSLRSFGEKHSIWDKDILIDG